MRDRERWKGCVDLASYINRATFSGSKRNLIFNFASTRAERITRQRRKGKEKNCACMVKRKGNRAGMVKRKGNHAATVKRKGNCTVTVLLGKEEKERKQARAATAFGAMLAA